MAKKPDEKEIKPDLQSSDPVPLAVEKENSSEIKPEIFKVEFLQNAIFFKAGKEGKPLGVHHRKGSFSLFSSEEVEHLKAQGIAFQVC